VQGRRAEVSGGRPAGVPEDRRHSDRSLGSPADAGVPFVSHRCGAVDAGTTVDFSLPLTNASRRPLKIVGHAVTCGCLSIRKHPETLAPSEHARVEFRLSTEGRPPGNFSQLARLETDDPEQPDFRFGVNAGVRGTWAEPARLDFGPGYPGQDAPRTLTLCALGFPGLEFVAIETDSRSFRVEFDGPPFVVDPGHGTNIGEPILCRHARVRIADDAAPGKWSGTLTVFSSVSTDGDLSVPVTAEVVSAVRCLPSVLLFTNVPRGRSRTAPLRLIVPSGRELDLSRLVVSTDLADLSAEVRSTSPARGEVAVTFRRKSSSPGILRGRVVGKVGGSHLFEVPVVVNAGAGGEDRADSTGSQ
jgi:hypothetical protein